MAVQGHVDVRIPLEDLAVNIALDGWLWLAGTNRLSVRHAELANILGSRNQGRCDPAHQEEGCRVVWVPDGEVTVPIEHSVEVQDVQRMDVSG
jgi:hypothetical protein